MKIKLVTIFLILNSFLTFSQQLIKGKVLDYDSKNPLEKVSIFVNNSSYNTITDENGYFTIQIPAANYSMIISYIGYESIELSSINLIANKTNVIELEKKIETLKTVSIISNKRRKDIIAYFLDNFIGTSRNAKNTTLLNPDVLDVEVFEDNSFQITATSPLEIENKNLNYKITFLLKDFTHSNENINSYQGFTTFNELSSTDKLNNKKINNNRHETYLGSPMHFIRSIYQNTLNENGFEIGLFAKKENPKLNEKPQNKVEVMGVNISYNEPQFVYVTIKQNTKKEDIIISGLDKQVLKFDNYLKISFDGKTEIAYRKKVNDYNTNKQYSQIKLNTDGIEIFADGSYSNTNGIIFYGYMGWKNIADLLPFDYLPNEE